MTPMAHDASWVDDDDDADGEVVVAGDDGCDADFVEDNGAD